MGEQARPPSWTEWEDPAGQALHLHTRKLSLPIVADRKRERPALWDISSGCILWLPKKYLISADALEKSQSLAACHPGICDHPVLVLDVKVAGPEDAVVSFMQMRSKPPSRRRCLQIAHFPTSSSTYASPLSGESLDRGSSTSSYGSFDSASTEGSGSPVQDGEVDSPLSDSMDDGEHRTVAQDNDHLLHLEKTSRNRSMLEHSFINTTRKYEIEWQELRCYAQGQKPDGYRFRLDQPSFQKVAEEAPHLVGSPEWIETGNLWETFVQRHIKEVPHTD